ncbi:Acetyltransferase (GNAT) family protein [Pseudooceanicola antarcticus]|uniref:Acetyltransferase (GNAT) family protein n=1 Tax=Pseudooceanicola antarcticus TaxID=1247613 RepID=A0A285ISI3_9RHOB|nr:GNAT family N-acetyltransferase [Pseudooceanicola antarcticus]PJE31950.1 N-acetyltransferase [Pseudooceanicola antarcticus]SNY50970.1 Acetyltransferase (GNAT) family protein [Pseudooceanicola antarcticus]
MPQLRAYQPGDLEALYQICLKTGDAGRDATALYSDPRLMGEIYAAPYGVLAPELTFVAEDAQGVAGYVTGNPDTRAWEARLEADWWPACRARYPDPSAIPPEARSPEQARAAFIHAPTPAPEGVVARYPAHMHMNILPRLQGHGMGRALFERWRAAARDAGVTGLHVGVNLGNPGGQAFWAKCGFVPLPEALTGPAPGTFWMGQDI